MGIRTITSYELEERKPYQAQLYKLAKALEVSTEYLQNDNIEDPSYGFRPHGICRRYEKKKRNQRRHWIYKNAG